MKHMIDPLEAKSYDHTCQLVLASGINGALALKRNPNRVTVIIAVKDATALTVGDRASIGPVRAGVLMALATISVNESYAVLRLEDYGQSLQEDLFVGAANNDVQTTVTEVFLSHRGPH